MTRLDRSSKLAVCLFAVILTATAQERKEPTARSASLPSLVKYVVCGNFAFAAELDSTKPPNACDQGGPSPAITTDKSPSTSARTESFRRRAARILQS